MIIIIIIKSENVRKTFHGLTLIFPESVESASLAAKYCYDEWLVSRFLEYVCAKDGGFFVKDGEATHAIYSSQYT